MSLRERSAARGPSAEVEAASRRAARRRSAGVVNRKLGWVVLPLVLLASVVHFGPGGQVGTLNTLVVVVQTVYVALIAVHVALSFYVFGWVRPSRTLRVFHVWFGYAYILCVLASTATIGDGAPHIALTVTMYLSLGVHVGIGIHYARRRRLADAARLRPSTLC